MLTAGVGTLDLERDGPHLAEAAWWLDGHVCSGCHMVVEPRLLVSEFEYRWCPICSARRHET